MIVLIPDHCLSIYFEGIIFIYLFTDSLLYICMSVLQIYNQVQNVMKDYICLLLTGNCFWILCLVNFVICINLFKVKN